MKKTELAVCCVLFLLAPPSRQCLALSIGGLNATLRVPGRMQAAVCTRANPDPCPGWVGDLGVHAAAAAMGEQHCSAHLERIEVVDTEVPTVAPGSALIKVAFSSVNPCGWKALASNTGPVSLGQEISGQVVELGSGCAGFSVGDRIWAMAGAAYQEYTTVPCSHLGLAPSSLSLQHAAALPAVSLTGVQGLEWAGAPWHDGGGGGPTVLVLGGSSGTGSAGIQLAKAYGAARVISTCSKGNFQRVRGFGADQVIDYHAENWWEVLGEKSVDVIYDCVCLRDTGNRAYDVLRDGGKFITIQSGSQASPEKAASRPQVSQYHYILDGAHFTTAYLDSIRAMADRGQLAASIDKAYDLHSVAQAYEQSISGHTVGKISISVDAGAGK